LATASIEGFGMKKQLSMLTSEYCTLPSPAFSIALLPLNSEEAIPSLALK
jgi:hypothetical protein